MIDRSYTVLLIPEKNDHIKKIQISLKSLKIFGLCIIFLFLLSIVTMFDYFYRLREVGEAGTLRIENRNLRQHVQNYESIAQKSETQLYHIERFLDRLKLIGDDSTKLALRNTTLTAIKSPPTPEIPTTNTWKNFLRSDAESPDHLVMKKEIESLNTRLLALTEKAYHIEESIHDEYEVLKDHKLFISALPTRRPASGYFTSGFGVRDHPVFGKIKMHEGLDIANRQGTLIKATAPGVVVFSGTKAGYGQTIIIDHGYGLETLYAHIHKLLVTKGQKLKRGTTIAIMGSTGYSTGSHVHYEVHIRGVPVNPLSYILEDS
jgi:murein DD-endopeptidase MepM/ murein hydrolase activator NlpD